MEAEQLMAAQLNDQDVDLEQLTRLTNCLIRLRKELGAAAKPTDPNQALRDFFQTLEKEKNNGGEDETD